MRLRHLSALALAATLAACSGSDSSAGDEPNDTIAQATAISADTLVHASIDDPYDVDYYRFTVPQGGAFVLVQTFDAGGVQCQGVDTFTELIEPDGTPYGSVVEWDDNGGVPLYCDEVFAFVPAGIYYVAVSFGGAVAPGFAYSLRVGVSAGAAGTSAESEQNGVIASADGPYAADALVSGTISPTGDYDYFAIANGSGVAKTVVFETFEGAVGYCPSADSTLYLYDAYGYLLASNDDAGVNTCSLLSYTIPAYTTYYLRVGGWAGDTFSYLLEIDFP